MSERRPGREEGSSRYDDFDRALLRAGRKARAPSGMRRRALVAAGVAAGGGAGALAATKTAAAAGASAAKTGTGLFASFGAKCALVAALGTASAAAVVAQSRVIDPPPAAIVVQPAPPSAPPLVPSDAPAPPAAREREAEAEATAAPETPAPVITKAVPARAMATAEGPPAAPGVVATAAPSALAEEIRLVDAARRALTLGDTSGALRLADEHAARFPAGTFVVEREVLRIDALVAAGRNAEAAADARAFVARHPHAAQAARLEKLATSSE